MTTFDLVEIRDFVAGIDSRMGPPLNGTRDDPAALAAARRNHAAICREFVATVREWRRLIFSGRIELDPAVEALVRAEAAQLAARADDLHPPGPSPEAPGPPPDDLGEFLAAVEPVRQMVRSWSTPRLAVGPGPRSWMHQTPEMIEEGRRRLATLPPLPADWPFTDEQRRALGLD